MSEPPAGSFSSASDGQLSPPAARASYLTNSWNSISSKSKHAIGAVGALTWCRQSMRIAVDLLIPAFQEVTIGRSLVSQSV